jgi:GMP reductase
MKIEQSVKLDFDDVLIKPNRSTLESRADVETTRTFKFYNNSRRLFCTPIICSNLASVAGIEMAKALQKYHMITCLHKYIDYNELEQEKNNINFDYAWFTIGYSNSELTKLEEFCRKNKITPCINIDVANGHIDSFVKYCAMVRNSFPDSIIMAGNVTAQECTQELIIHGGVDIVKVGTGPGRFCKTRMVTGVGYPQLSAIINNSNVAHGLKNGDKKLGLICGDGGCKDIGDICKGFSAGSDFLMLGNIFSGVDECCGEWTYKDSYTEYENIDIEINVNKLTTKDIINFRKLAWQNNIFMSEEDPSIILNPKIRLYQKYRKRTEIKDCLKVYGMSSEYAQEKFGTGKKEYRASEGEECILVPYKGPVDNIIKQIYGGLRSCCTYIGAESIKDMSKCTTFLLCNKQK